MHVEKRKQEDDREAYRKKGKLRPGDTGLKVEVPADEEVEEFFCRVRRMQVVSEYFKKRKGSQLTAASWIPLLEREDFGRVEGGDAKARLDLNSDPVDESESGNVPDSG